MLHRKLIKTTWCELCKRHIHNTKCTNTNSGKHDIKKIRNLGILAHIDAGKTTTTERMLYYSGFIKNMGEVHHGNTVTDYMEQERQRGITITSAAVTFDWKKYRFNLIDTPGHIDFTMEVEQALRVMDGAVVIVDGSAGVEAQTLTVCRQAEKYKIPMIIYVNKMDRSDADLEKSLRSVELKLNVNALPTQYPIKTGDTLEGIVDVICLEKIIFDQKHQGLNFVRRKLIENEDKDLWNIVNEKREILIDKLSNLDDKLADIVIEEESFDKISNQMLIESLRRITLSRKGVPVLLGSSYKNIGVQPLMDSVNLYWHYEERRKIIQRAKRKAVTGLNTTVTGDLITNSASALKRAENNMKKKKSSESDGTHVDILTSSTVTPDPVFFCSIEPPSLSKQLPLEIALQELEREDPSLRVKQDEETGQTVLAGMGELHIEVIKERIRTEYKIDVDLGPLQIAYKETMKEIVKNTYSSEHKIGKTTHSVTVTMSLIPDYKKKEILQFDHTRESASNIDSIHPKTMSAVRKGMKLALQHGPKINAPIIDTGIKLHWLEVRRGTSDTMVSAAVTQCIKQLMHKGESMILEPIMNVEIVTSEEFSSAVIADLGQRRSEIQDISMRGQNKVITAFTPLANLLGYSTRLRIITSGNSTFTIEFSHYKAMESITEQETIKKITGF
ncbi:hypothetical protein KPH14_002839 [Odynerus spinipes]|uniref:Tr-type G domain-containing protein n=1 Tax=Odynerus spinipes TaxID=1348599 RepID=A0AAD9VLD1_9HYME|nr:hypothetical protein KPH14_002839 [Odynerus spinipes]